VCPLLKAQRMLVHGMQAMSTVCVLPSYGFQICEFVSIAVVPMVMKSPIISPCLFLLPHPCSAATPCMTALFGQQRLGLFAQRRIRAAFDVLKKRG